MASNNTTGASGLLKSAGQVILVEKEKVSGKTGTFVAPVDGVLLFEFSNEHARWHDKAVNTKLRVGDEFLKPYQKPETENKGVLTHAKDMFLYGGLYKSWETYRENFTYEEKDDGSFTTSGITRGRVARFFVEVKDGQDIEWEVSLEDNDIVLSLTFQCDVVRLRDTMVKHHEAAREEHEERHAEARAGWDAEREGLADKVAVLESDIVALRGLLDDAAAEKAEKAAEYDEVAEERNRWMGQVTAMREENEALNKKHLEWMDKTMHAEKGRSKLRGDLDASTTANQALRDLVAELEKELARKEALLSEARSELEQALSKSAMDAQQCVQQEERLQAAGAREKELVEASQAKSAELEAATATKALLDEKLAATTQKVAELGEELRQEQERAALAALAAKQAGGEAKDTAQDCARLRDELARVSECAQSAESEKASLLKVGEALRATLGERQLALTEALSRATAHEVQLAELRQCLDAAESGRSVAEQAGAEAKTQLEQEKAKVTDFKEKLLAQAGAMAAEIARHQEGKQARQAQYAKAIEVKDATIQKKDATIAALKEMLTAKVDEVRKHEAASNCSAASNSTSTAAEEDTTPAHLHRLLLWVDDHPVNNQAIVEAAFRGGVTVLQMSSSKVALQYLGSPTGKHLLAHRDASVRVMTNMSREGEGPTAGFELVAAMRDMNLSIPAMIYTSDDLLVEANKLVKEKGLLNVLQTEEEEKALDFALFHDTCVETFWSSRRANETRAAAPQDIVGAFEFPSDEDGAEEELGGGGVVVNAVDPWKSSLERLAEMQFYDLAKNRRLLEERMKAKPSESEVDRIQYVVHTLVSEA